MAGRDQEELGRFTRRALLKGTAAGAGSMALAGAFPFELRAARAANRKPVPLPTAAQIRADIQRMVDFGPRLTGNDAHNSYIAWLEQEFVAAGCELLPCDVFQTSRWTEESFGLDVLEGPGAGPVKVASYFPRSQQTPAGGVTGPLVYGGVAPALSMNGASTSAFLAAIEAYPAQFSSWADGLSGLLGADPQGSVMVVDLPMPPPVTVGELFGSSMTYYNGQGETVADLATVDYKRLWTVPGLALPLDSFTAMGVAGVVFIVDASYESLAGQYAPFEWFNEDVPALYVDRDTGTGLRAQTATRPSTRLTLTAVREEVPTPTVTAVLPGQSDEVIIFDTHTDGQGFVEENGGVAFVHLARYFASLPADKRLKRTLVFACWPGHMSNDLPQATGWIDAHEDLIKRAAAALTVEHLGCTEWDDSLEQGYHPTGRAEVYAVWTTQGKMFELTRDTVVAHDLPRTALMRPPAQFGVGGPFQAAGVPQIGGLAGPDYLLTISDSGEMDKLDATLAARQIAWLADLATKLDPVPAAELRQGDPTLGLPSFTGNIVPSSETPTEEACGPGPAPAGPAPAAKPSLKMRFIGRRKGVDGFLVALTAHGGRFSGVTIELRRDGRVLARSRPAGVGAAARKVVLRPIHGRHISAGRCTLLALHGGRVLADRAVHVR